MRSIFAFSTVLSLLCCSFAWSKQPTPNVKPKPEAPFETPWLTGPLLTPSAHTIPDGHFNIEPYEFVTVNDGVYNNHWKSHDLPHNFYSVSTQIPIQIGLPAGFDIQITPQWEWNHVHHASHWALNDLGVAFDYQLYNRNLKGPWPSVKLTVGGKIPIGKYDHLDRHSLTTDGGGTGSWLPTIALTFSHLVHIKDRIFFAPRWAIQYTVPTPVFVKGYNVYGGGHGTRGTVFPGQSLTALFGCELSLSKNWALATDFQYVHANKNRFKGKRGSTHGVPNPITAPSSESFSVAPAIEYNWSAYYGVIAGAWFTVAGRNTTEFVSGVIAFNIYH
jgi:hypothetical protein